MEYAQFPHTLHVNPNLHLHCPFPHTLRLPPMLPNTDTTFPPKFNFQFREVRATYMATKSDFAEKLLRDLRLRKERMAATENSSQVMFGENRSPVGSSGSLNTEGSSNQIILLERGKSSSQVTDLSMAIAFALDNTAKISTPSSNPLLNFFNRLDCRKMGISNSGKHSPPTIPSVSHIDNLTEISKAVLRACSRGLNININSMEVGQELLKGAVDLEESLRMLVNLEEASECMNGAQRRSRLTLLDGDDVRRDGTHKRVNRMQLDRPIFSFDKPSKNSHLVAQKNKMTKEQESTLSCPHRRTASCVPDFDGPQVRNSSCSTQEKGRISNVIAKLMGLEELPRKESMKKDLGSRENERKVSSKTRKFAEFDSERSNGLLLNKDHKSIRTQNSTPVRDLKSDIKAEKRQEIDDSFKMVMVERNVAGGTGTVSAPKTATSMMKKLQKDSTAQNEVTGLQIFHGGEERRAFVEDRERKMAETRLNNGPQQKPQLIEYNVSANCLEKRNGNKDLKQMAKDKRTAQVEVLKKSEHSEDKNRAGPKGQQIQKESLMTTKPRGRYMESMVSAKTSRSATNLHKKQNNDKTTYENGTSMKPTEEVGVRDPPNVDASPGNSRKEDRNQNPSPRQPQNENEKATDSNLQTPDKHTDVLAKKKKAIYKEIQKSENFRKMDVPMTKKSRPVNDLKISLNQSATMLQELKQQMHKKTSITKGREQESDIQENRGEVGIIVSDASEEVRELKKQLEKVKNDAEQTTLFDNSVGDECQTENMQDILPPNDNCSDRDSNSGKVSSDLQKVEPCASEDEKHLKQYDQHNEGRKASMASHNLSKPDEQSPESGRQEQLVEPEKELKDIVMKNQHLTEPQKDLKVIVVENHYLTGPEKEPKEIVIRNQHLIEPEKQPKEIVICNQPLTEPEKELREIAVKKPEKEPKEIVTKNQQLTEPEKELKEIVLKNHLFLNTAEALFKLNIPVSFLHAGDQNQEVGDKKLILDCGYEIMKRKARRNELTLHPYNITTLSCSKLRSLDDLVKKLCKDFEMLKLYGGSWDDEIDIASYLYKMVEKDMHGKDPDLNCMWDLEWNDMMSMFCEKEDVVRDVEKHLINVLLDEMTNDLFRANFSV